jgi:hypothetical protein
MACHDNLFTRTALVSFFIVGWLVMTVSSAAQERGQYLPSTNRPNYQTDAGDYVFIQPAAKTALLPQAAQTSSSGGAGNAPASADNQWHFTFSPYLWFAGMHGTVGALDRDLSFHASPGDILSHFDIGLMGETELSRNRILIPIDLLWIRLSDSQPLPFPSLSAVSADARVGQFVLTPKIGYRVFDSDLLKIDALTGFRYWHLGEKLSFNPSALGLNFSGSQSWTDPLVGGRIQTFLSSKSEFTIAGDVGGWGAGSQLDYQVVGLIGYKMKPKATLQVGYRYLHVDYRSGGATYDTNTSGALFGVTFKFK